MVTGRYNPSIPEVHADPYPLYPQLRAEDPVHWNDIFEGWVFTRYDHVVSVLEDPRFSADRRQSRNRIMREVLSREEELQGPFARRRTAVPRRNIISAAREG